MSPLRSPRHLSPYDGTILQPAAKPEVSKPAPEEKENSFPVCSADTTVEETSIVNESYDNSSSWESYEGSPKGRDSFDGSAHEAIESDKYSAIAQLDDELEDEKWEERTAVITSADHQDNISAASDILREVLSEVKTPVKG